MLLKKTDLKMCRCIIVCIYSFLILFQCANEYNPYSDISNAKVNILRPSDGICTIPIFTTDTVELLFTVCNLIEKVTVVADSNRHFSSLEFSNICGLRGRKIFPVSFYDTGFHNVKIVTHLISGDSTLDLRRYYVVSELNQDDITGCYRCELKLRATSQDTSQDRDTKYVWKIGSEKPVISVHDTATTRIDNLLLNDSGTLQICDYQEKWFSPPVYFKVSLIDTVKPEIVIKNPNINDTIHVSGDTLFLHVEIDGCVSENTVSINGKTMAGSGFGSNNFIDAIGRVGSEQDMRIEIIANDRFDNQSSKTAYIVFNSDIQINVIPHIEIIGHPGDEVVSAQQNYELNGRVVFNANSELTYSVLLFNGEFSVDSHKVSGTETFEWSFILNLDEEHNFYRIEVRDSLANVVDDTTLDVRYCANCVDTVPPVIASILVNNDTLSSSYCYTSKSKMVSIELICFDLGSGVDSVLIGDVMMSHDSSASYRWIINKNVSYILNPDTLTFHAVDSNEIRSDSVCIIIGYNTPPYLEKTPNFIRHAFIGDVYVDTVLIGDNDPEDYVMYTIRFGMLPVGGRSDLFIDEYGEIRWTPKNTDLGFNVLNITGTDRYGARITFSDTVYVSNVALDTIRFLTSGKDFPKTHSCTDSLIVPLKVTGGTRPFTIGIKDISTQKTIMVNSNDSIFRWKPEMVEIPEDHQFLIIVRDILGLADTLWPVVTILPENRIFEVIETYWTGVIKTDSILDLSGVNPDTLFYKIHDPDSTILEMHTIDIELGHEKYTISTDTSAFFVQLDPLRKKSGTDSLLLKITDIDGHIQMVKKMLYYGYPPDTVILKMPLHNEVVESSSIQFSWSCADPDNEMLHYDFSLFSRDGAVIHEQSVTLDTILMVSGLKKTGIYFWNIVAHDAKSSSESVMRKISYIPPDKVRFDTVVSKLPELVRCNTKVMAPIVIKNGYPPFNIEITQSVTDNKPEIKNDSIVWVPDCFQAGKHFITLEVTDSVGNGDKFTFQTSVYGSDSLTVSLISAVPRNDAGEIDLSSSLVNEVACTLSINDPDPSPPDSFTVEILLGNVRQEFYSKSIDRIIALTLKHDPSKLRDTLSVKVTEMKGITSIYTDSLFYGN